MRSWSAKQYGKIVPVGARLSCTTILVLPAMHIPLSAAAMQISVHGGSSQLAARICRRRRPACVACRQLFTPVMNPARSGVIRSHACLSPIQDQLSACVDNATIATSQRQQQSRVREQASKCSRWRRFLTLPKPMPGQWKGVGDDDAVDARGRVLVLCQHIAHGVASRGVACRVVSCLSRRLRSPFRFPCVRRPPWFSRGGATPTPTLTLAGSHPPALSSRYHDTSLPPRRGAHVHAHLPCPHAPPPPHESRRAIDKLHASTSQPGTL